MNFSDLAKNLQNLAANGGQKAAELLKDATKVVKSVVTSTPKPNSFNEIAYATIDTIHPDGIGHVMTMEDGSQEVYDEKIDRDLPLMHTLVALQNNVPLMLHSLRNGARMVWIMDQGKMVLGRYQYETGEVKVIPDATIDIIPLRKVSAEGPVFNNKVTRRTWFIFEGDGTTLCSPHATHALTFKFPDHTPYTLVLYNSNLAKVALDRTRVAKAREQRKIQTLGQRQKKARPGLSSHVGFLLNPHATKFEQFAVCRLQDLQNIKEVSEVEEQSGSNRPF